MRKICFALTIIILTAGCNNESIKKNKTTEMDTEATAAENGWVYLFDGKTTAGWRNYGKTTIGEAWKVADGTLYLDTTQKNDWQTRGGGDIMTIETFKNFDLKLDWKIAPGGNSGIIFYVHEDTSKYQYVWNTGMEMQVLDNEAHPDAKIFKHRAGDLYDLIASSPETVKPAGEWNEVEIKSVDGKLDFFLNGVNVVSTTLWDEKWRTLVAGSKFKAYPDFGTYKEGHISLQDHGNMVWYRNIRIKKL